MALLILESGLCGLIDVDSVKYIAEGKLKKVENTYRSFKGRGVFSYEVYAGDEGRINYNGSFVSKPLNKGSDYLQGPVVLISRNGEFVEGDWERIKVGMKDSILYEENVARY